MGDHHDRFDLLLERLLRGEATDAELVELEQLIAGDAQRELLYRACTEGAPDDLLRAEASYQRHWEKVRRQEAMLIKGWRSRINPWWSAAAAVLICVGLLVLWMVPDPDPQREFATQNGERRRINLPDGSTVWLNGGSRMIFEVGFNVTHRRLSFRGEGYFEVVSNADLPFEIDAGEASLQVLGTSFNLRAYDGEDKLEAALITGALEVRIGEALGSLVRLAPGEKVAIYKPGTILPDEAREDTGVPVTDDLAAVRSTVKITEGEEKANEVLWMVDKLVFDGDPLDMISSKLEKWYGKQVVIADSTMTDLRFSGIFKDMELDAVLKALSQTGGLHYTISGDTVVLQRRDEQ